MRAEGPLEGRTRGPLEEGAMRGWRGNPRECGTEQKGAVSCGTCMLVCVQGGKATSAQNKNQASGKAVVREITLTGKHSQSGDGGLNVDLAAEGPNDLLNRDKRGIARG